ncbi:MAG: HAD family hydrolase [Candidatus Glassbacteria bacterium]|nr:HAD family hydrolase [Candidatus Glassbacteria bacterium]
MRKVRSAEYKPLTEGLYALHDGPLVKPDSVDAIIFDVDGVLVEVSGSFRQVISLTVQHYFNRVLNVPGEARLLTAEETGLFKLAGDFNNDWDLSKGAVAFCLMKQICSGNGSSDTAAIRNAAPSLEEFTSLVGRLGGGLGNAVDYAREQLDDTGRTRFDSEYRPELIKRIFMEYYAGPGLSEELYGIRAEHYDGPGLIEQEVFLLNLSLIERLQKDGLKFGILSGRTPGEAAYLFRKQGLDKLLEPEFILTDDGGLPGKPNPAGLALLARRMEFAGAIYVGDVPDDWATVLRYRSEHPELPPVAGCMVSTGAVSHGILDRYIEGERVDYLAADVNHLLSAVNDFRRGV